jgi:hypothetical protein
MLAWRSEDGNWVWTFVLTEEHGNTRLLSRNRFRLPAAIGQIGMLPMEPGSLVMERKMLHGIKERAERLVDRLSGECAEGVEDDGEVDRLL